MVQLCFIQKTPSHRKCLGSLALRIFFACFQVEGKVSAVDEPDEIGHDPVSPSQHFDQLQISEVISVCFKRSVC